MMDGADRTIALSLVAVATATTLTTTSSVEWNERMAEYLRRDALTRANDAFGPSAKLENERYREDLHLEAQFGPTFRDHPEARATLDARSHALTVASEENSDQFYRPVWQAQRELVLTPAPNLAAALFKIELIETAEVWNDSAMPRDCFEIVAEDMARLAGEAV